MKRPSTFYSYCCFSSSALSNSFIFSITLNLRCCRSRSTVTLCRQIVYQQIKWPERHGITIACESLKRLFKLVFLGKAKLPVLFTANSLVFLIFGCQSRISFLSSIIVCHAMVVNILKLKSNAWFCSTL